MPCKKPESAVAYGYARVSLDSQLKGESLEVQRARIEAICIAEGLTLASIFIEEGVSGSRPLNSRPEGAKLLAKAKRGDTIVILRLDRGFRSTADALSTVADLNCRGVKLYVGDMRGFIAGDAAGELHFSMLASFSQFERRRIAERIRESKQQLKAKGRYCGGHVPFGYTVVATGETTRQGVPAMRLEPIEVSHTIARDLMSKGYSSRLGAGHFKAHGIDATHHAVNGLFRQLCDPTTRNG